MFNELTRYKHKGQFFFKLSDSLSKVCNAPSDKSGIYLVYALKNGKLELVYIGRSGRVKKDGSIFIRKAGLGGIKDRIVNGHQFGKIPRRISWKRQIELENIEALDIYWFVTYDDEKNDCPRIIENNLLNIHSRTLGMLPRWNKK